MIDYIKGKVVEIGENHVTVETNGIGYGLVVSANTTAKLKMGSEAHIYTFLSVREDGVSLFGFYSKQEKAMFSRLLTVSGIGPKMAVAILSGIGVDELAAVIAGGDFTRLTGIKGVGKKTAERLVLELKDNLAKEFGSIGLAGGVAASKVSEDAVLALMSMGFSKQEATAAVTNAGAGDRTSVEEIVIAALKRTK
ncbi:MAG: Holliday junction branch migration protein RuvA [Firmicutes bacterium]|nr:Holliday junction branch migration protein RuvA [Bacillota bacterium]